MQEIETLYPEDNKQKKKNNNKDFILLVIVILIITVICTVGLLKMNGKKEEAPKVEEKDNFSSKKEKKTLDEIEEELQTKNYVYRKYSCEKSDDDDVALDNGIKVRNKHRYEFIFNEGVDDTPNLGYYYVDYIFNNLNDYRNTTALPIPFEDKTYEEQENINTLTKTQLFYYILEYPNIAYGDFAAYLKALENDKFVCTLVEKEEIINNYDVYYGRDTGD